ncbi:MAG: DUF4097 family beta strand repeat-containing protein [Acidimicrobiia bacterium]
MTDEPTGRPGIQIASFESHQPIALSIELSQGVVHAIAGDRTDTVVTVNPSNRDRPADVDAARQTVVDLANGTLSIRAPKRRGLAGYVLGPSHRTGSVDVTVELPEGSSLTTEAGYADFRCDGRLGDVDIRTGAGNVRLDRTGSLRVYSGAGRVAVEGSSGNATIVTSGEMTIGTVTGDVDIKNHNGRTSISRVGGSVRVKSANGDVTIEAAGADVSAKTANGDIRLGQIARGSATIETAFGELEIGIKEGTAAWIDANTSFGRIHNNLAPADEPERSSETVQVHARTAYGDVLIKRS